jgi:DNA-binding GntR family transcriptional regulator
LFTSVSNNGSKRVDDATLYRRIYQGIIEHHLPPGTKLAEEALAAALGVSRTRIRKVLLDLSHEGMVTIQSNHGARVARPSIKEAHEIFAVRRMLEPAIARVLASHASSDQVAELRRFTEEEMEAHEHRDRRTAIRLSCAFHLKLVALAENSTLMSILGSLMSRSMLVVAIYGAIDWSSCAAHEHLHLIELIEAGDVDGAGSYMDDHLRHVEESLKLDYDPDAVDMKAVFSRILETESEGHNQKIQKISRSRRRS